MESSEEYLCQGCGRTILKSNKRLHDLKFHPSMNNNTNQRNNNIINRNLNERNYRNNYNRNSYNKNINYISSVSSDLEDIIDNRNININELRNMRDRFFSLNLGLDDDTINNYPISKIKDINKLSEDKKRCTICLEDFKNNDDTIILPCIHIFHEECIKNWMKQNDSCPICKYQIKTEINE